MQKILKPDKFPTLLKNIYNPPKKLYYKGDLSALKRTCIAIVGTRRHTEYGEYITQKIVEELSPYDVSIVSGLAKGIDTCAHRAALDNNVPTIAVFGNGLDKIFPRENTLLAKEIEKNGLLISEYEPDAPGLKAHFPQRNRIISGISIASIVVEAPERSGALITARFALEQGRDIFVVPGDIHRQNSQGGIHLLQRGAAYPITSGHDIIEYLRDHSPLDFELSPEEKVVKAPIDYNLSPEEEKTLAALNQYRGTPLDKIQEKTKLPTQSLLATLSLLEIQGLIRSTNGKFRRTT